MTITIALLQGVNIGKNKRVAMADLRRIVTDLGGEDPKTLANSGNVVYRNGPNADQLEKAVSDHVGVEIPVITRSMAELESIIAANPFPDAVAEPKSLHVDFLRDDMPDALAGIDQGKDTLTLVGRELYMHLPNLISGATYDARALNKRLGTHHTSRNWSTITRLLEISRTM